MACLCTVEIVAYISDSKYPCPILAQTAMHSLQFSVMHSPDTSQDTFLEKQPHGVPCHVHASFEQGSLRLNHLQPGCLYKPDPKPATAANCQCKAFQSLRDCSRLCDPWGAGQVLRFAANHVRFLRLEPQMPIWVICKPESALYCFQVFVDMATQGLGAY